MDEQNIITEKDYPIETRWIFKSIMRSILSAFIFTFLVITDMKDPRAKIFLTIFFSSIPIDFIYSALRRSTFHYFLEDNFLLIKQGIFSKQQRHIPYEVIQNLYVKQDFFDRIFDLSSLMLENASSSMTINSIQTPIEQTAGFSGNQVNIPGLSKQNAETLKNIILQKIKENPMTNNTSGL